MFVYGMNVSADGYVVDEDGNFDWSAPAPDVHGWYNEQARESVLDVYGRRLYETMRYWEQPDPSSPDVELEFAEVWQATPKVVVSRSLDGVEDYAKLVRSPDEIADVDGLANVGGADLAASMIDRIDEFRPVVFPVAVGGGTPFFPAGLRVDLKLVESRAFESGPVYLRYQRL